MNKALCLFLAVLPCGQAHASWCEDKAVRDSRLNVIYVNDEVWTFIRNSGDTSISMESGFLFGSATCNFRFEIFDSAGRSRELAGTIYTMEPEIGTVVNLPPRRGLGLSVSLHNIALLYQLERGCYEVAAYIKDGYGNPLLKSNAVENICIAFDYSEGAVEYSD